MAALQRKYGLQYRIGTVVERLVRGRRERVTSGSGWTSRRRNSRLHAGSGRELAAVDVVGVAGFEPTAPRSQSECATKLRHTPSGGV